MMDLSNFKLMKEDNDSYHIQHPNGKPMRLKKGQLSNQSHQMIKTMCSGGKMYAEGGEVADDKMPVDQYQNQPVTEGVPQSLSPEAPAMQQAPFQPQASVPLNSTDVATPAPAGNMEAKAPAAQPAQAAPLDPYEQEIQTIQKQGNIQSGLANTEAKAMEEGQAKVAKLPTSLEIFNKYKAADDQMMKAMSEKKIDPNRLYNSLSTGQKVMAGISMILGGIGNGLTHSSAPLMMEDAIARDIDAQKADQSNKMNMWKMNREMLGSETQASLATENQIYNGVEHMMNVQKMKAQSPMAKLAADQAVSLIKQKKQQIQFKMMASNPEVQNSESDFINNIQKMHEIDPKIEEEMRKNYIPSVGRTKTPPTDDQRKNITAADNFTKEVDKALALVAKGPTFKDSEASAVNKQVRDSLILSIGALHGLNRINEHEWGAYQEMVNGLGDIRSNVTKAQLEGLRDIAQGKKQSELTSLAVVPFAQPPQDSYKDAKAREIVQKYPASKATRDILQVRPDLGKK